VGHDGRDSVYYEELHDGAWRRLAIDGEMLTGGAHHVICSPALLSRKTPRTPRCNARRSCCQMTVEEKVMQLSSVFPLALFTSEGPNQQSGAREPSRASAASRWRSFR
jgi:hypothetical protein